MDRFNQNSASKSKRNHALDFLRGVAILMVIGQHNPLRLAQSGQLQSVSWIWLECGWIGVDLFFVLSGFLIGGLLLTEIKKTEKLEVLEFLVRRGMRLWPTYVLLLLFLCTGLTLVNADSNHNMMWNWLHLQNYMGGVDRPHLWSLAVEEHFYLVLPFLLCLLLFYKRLHYIPVLALALCVLCFLGRNAVSDPKFAYEATHLRVDGLFFGVFLAYLTHYKPKVIELLVKRRFALFCVGVLLVLPSIVFHQDKHFVVTFGLTMNTLGFGAILLALIHTKETDGLPGKLLFNPIAQMVSSIGYFSYGIYVWHIDFAHIPVRFFYPLFEGMPLELSWIAGSLVYAVLAVQTGVLMSKLIEIPILNLRDRLVPRTVSFEPLQDGAAQAVLAQTIIEPAQHQTEIQAEFAPPALEAATSVTATSTPFDPSTQPAKGNYTGAAMSTPVEAPTQSGA